MKAILEFNLPEDQREFNFARQGSDWQFVAWKIDRWLREQYKYMPDEEDNEDKYNTYIEVRNKLREIMDEQGVNLEP